jgi:hypothetical protein
MKCRNYLVLPALFSVILLGGCATYPTLYGPGYGFNPNAVTGAVTGAALGTVASAVAGNPGAGAAIGGVVGALSGLGTGPYPAPPLYAPPAYYGPPPVYYGPPPAVYYYPYYPPRYYRYRRW